jgi:RNA polymerase sigma factor (sigma-70 family)
MTETQQLLRRYTKEGSESAFRDLVRRYLDLVFSVALRKMGGNQHLAEDVTQTVFADLARKARRLPGDVLLGGWLHQHTCFVASNVLRTDRRRHAREKEAIAMNALQQDADAEWKQLAPVLDDIIGELDAPDRHAIVLRYFERHDFRAVGASLGISDDAAQKRVSRAVGKLRELLARRGATLTGLALAGILAEKSVQAAPAKLAATVAARALTGAATAGGTAALLKLLLSKPAVAVLAGIVLLGVVLPLVIRTIAAKNAATTPTMSTAGRVAIPGAGAGSLVMSNASPVARQTAAQKTASEDGVLRLAIVAADTGKPVPAVQVDYRRWEGGKYTGKTLMADAWGVCEVHFPLKSTTDLELTTRIDGFADTRLDWQPAHGEMIPQNYALRLTRPVWIGGRVVGPDDEPVGGASVGFNHEDDPGAATRPESHEFGWIEVKTDATGRWQINRIAPEMLRRIYGQAKHPDYVESGLPEMRAIPELEKQLREGTAVLRLKRAITVQGSVVDPAGQPVPDANVLVGKISMSDQRETSTFADGTFVVRGCRPGKNLLSAEAKGFAATTMEVELAADSPPFTLTLQRGRVLRLRVVDQNGRGIPGANVWLDTMRNRHPSGPKEPPPAQVHFNPKTDTEGRLVLESAPDVDLAFDAAAPGYMRTSGATVHPDGEEHLIVLRPAQVITGTVRDATSGEKVTKFQITAGWPETNVLDHTSQPYWSTIGRFTVGYEGGEFRHAMEEPVAVRRPDFVFKFEADGYAPFVTRVIRGDEGEVPLDVTLRRAEEKRVLISLPDGSPAVDADVAFVGKATRLTIIPGGLSRNQTKIITTDNQGSFILPDDESILRVIVAHAAGFIETTPAELTANPNVRLGAWGRIEGTYLSGGEPATGRTLSIQYAPRIINEGYIYMDFEKFSETVDAQGQFVFPQAPPGQHKLGRWMPASPPASAGTRQLMPLADVEVRSGETTTLTIGSGYEVSVRLVWADDWRPGKGTQTFVMMRTGFPAPPAEIAGNAAALEQWRQTPEIQEALKNAHSYRLNEEADGTWAAEGVLAGNTYTVEASVWDQNAPNAARAPIVSGRTTVAISAEPADGKINAGEIVLHRVEPR